MKTDTAADWTYCADQLPPEGVTVETKIYDEHGERNQSRLKRKGGLWFFPDMSMYVYYRPTHWRALAANEKEAS